MRKLYLKYDTNRIEIYHKLIEINHSDTRVENNRMTNDAYQDTVLFRACRIGSIVLVDTLTCDILIYAVPGDPKVYVTRINGKKLITVYNPDKEMYVSPSKIRCVYFGKEGSEMLYDIIQNNIYMRDFEEIILKVRNSKVVDFKMSLE